jgi:HSP20 family molecular chaperone IbpA
MVSKLNDKDKKDIDEFLKGLSEEFRSVRFYSNIDGLKKEYGYDYKRDSEGKEEYREIGEIPEDFGKDFIDRLTNINRSFDWDNDFFSRTLERFSEIFPSFDRLVGGFSQPKLLSGSEEELITSRRDEQQSYEVAYDLQVDKDKNELYLIIELPGFAKEHVDLKLLKNGLLLAANNGTRQIDTKIPIEQVIDRDEKISATMRHGILEVKLKLLDNANGDETNIPIN